MNLTVTKPLPLSLTIMHDRMKLLEELQTYISDDKTINDLVRKQAFDWAELFWKNRSHKEKAGKGSKS